MKESAQGTGAAGSEVTITSGFLREPNLGRQLFGGYSVEETDALLYRAASMVDKLRRELTTTRQETAEPARAPEGAPSPAAPSNGPDAAHAVGELMITAHEALRLLKDRAEQEAREVVETAHAEASAIVAEAAKERTRLEEHQAEAEKIVERARLEAAAVVANARNERKQILADTEQLKVAAEQLRHTWISQFSQMIDQLSDRAETTANGEPSLETVS